MRIDLKSIFDLSGEKKGFQFPLDLSEEEMYGGFPFKEPVLAEGEIENRAGVVRLVFSVKFPLQLCCDRCLTEFSRDFEYSFEHILVRSMQGDNDEYVVIEDGILDLDELIRSDLLLELPAKVLCRPDCKGLCVVCGKNLNFDSCECNKKEIDPRLQILGTLLS